METKFNSFKSYLKNYKKYILLRSKDPDDNIERYIILENLNTQFKKLYMTNDDGVLIKKKEDFFFKLSFRNFSKWFVFDSDNLEDIFSKFELLKSTEKYNI